jgi:DNA-binding GntR family transcriptional regulator
MTTQPTGSPAYQQIAGDLRAEILRGDLAVGEQVPALGVLESRYGVSSTVVRAALKVLREEGLVVTHPGKGTFVQAAQSVLAADDGDVRQHLRLIYDRLVEIDERLMRLEDKSGA